MNMARPRKPTNVLELKGAFKHDPSRGRERENEPAPKAGIGPPPPHLAADEQKVWDEIVGLAPVGVFGDCDRMHVEVTARLMALLRRVGIEAIDPAKLNRLDAMLGKLGMNPSDRSKVKVIGGGKSRNPFDSI